MSVSEFFYTLRVRYSEVDAQARVFNAHYLTYFDTGLNEYMRFLGYDYLEETKKTGLDFVVTRSLIEYKAPAAFDEELEIHIKPGSVKPASIQWDLRILKKKDGSLVCTGELTWAFVDLAKGVPAKLPSFFKELKSE